MKNDRCTPCFFFLQEAYDVTVYSLEKPSFSATAKCKYGGCVVNVTACTGDGLPYILKGCSPHGALVCWWKLRIPRIPTSGIFQGESWKPLVQIFTFFFAVGNLEGQKDMLTKQTLWKQSNNFWLDSIVLFLQFMGIVWGTNLPKSSSY